ncbi:STAS domain-containing protein [Paractinoplanes brasiliensis]|uniref:Anti-sigma factor antagonist n=1 Tax=Paractinoplanes brasiliensis TaxID=52695 RepID=A0A4R6JBJ4_9ACTN|nr:STAS domain-containing protein [Actinoplanes brasiliensis]TDO32902.1 anti-anti-sigma factor [Actinoplanes brasiliensis]GID28618.1 hypothetical protein Abr02nite_36010 [Actinoplanes brasiliensis]
MHGFPERVILDVGVRECGEDAVLISVAGEVDGDNCAELRSRLTGHDARHVTLDLDALTFIGSAGVRELLYCREVVEQLGGTLMISRAHENVRQILTLCGLTELLASPQYDRN